MAKRDRELRHRLEELFSSEAEAPPPDPGPIDPANQPANTTPVDATPIESVARALDALPPDLWKTILDHLPLPVYLKDREHTWIAVNGACSEILGRPAGMLVGHVDKEQSDEAWQLDDQVLESGQADDSQVSSTALDSSVHTRRTRRVPLIDEHGQVRYVLGIIEDHVKPVGTDHTASAASVDSTALARFQAIVEATPVPILITRIADGRPLYVNARASAMFGVAREDLLNHTTLEFYDTPTDRQQILAILQREGRVANYELRLKRPDGSRIWVMLDVQPLVYNNERAVLSGFYDITARKQAEQHLRNSEVLYQSLVEAIPENLCRKDTQGRFTYGNRHYCELVGLSLDELIGKTDFDIHPPELAEKYRADDQAVMAGGKVVDFEEAHVVLGTGEQNHVHTIKTPLYDANGHVSGVQIMFWDITEQVRTQQALNLRTSALEAAANGVAITDRTGQIVWINPAFTQLTGYTFEEAVGQNPRVLKSGIHSTEFYQHLWQTITSGQVWQGELINRRKDGREYPEEMTITPVRAQGGEITHFIAIKQDISARKQANEQLRNSEALYQSLVDTIPENLCRKDAQGRFTYGNRHYCELVGLSLSELIGKTDYDLHPPELADKYRADDQAVMAGGKAVEFLEEHVVLATGEKNYVRTIKNPLYDAQGQVMGIQIMFWDATELGRAEQALKLRTSALEAAANGVTITDRAGKIIWVNPAFTQLTGYTFDEAVGQHTRILNSGRQSKAFYDAMWQTILSGHDWHGELINRRKDGREYDEEITITPVRATGAEITHFIAVMQDIRERKRNEEQILRFKLGMERSGDAIFITDLDGKIEYVNPAFETTYGYPAAEALGRTPRILKSGVIPPEQYTYFWQTLKAKGTIAGEIINQTKDGRHITIEGANTPIIDEAGELVGFLAVHRDVTARKQVEHNLAVAAERLQLIITNVPDLIYIKDRQSRWVVANQPVADSLGAATPADMIGKSDFDFHPRELAEQFYADEQALLASGQPILNKEERVIGPDGIPIWLSTTKVPFRGPDGQIDGLIGVARNITQLKQIELERERLLAVEARRAVQLQTGSEIANAAATILDPDKLLPVVVELVRERYDLYYAGLFLIDASGHWAELRAGTGEAGRKMMEGHHRLEIGGASMIGRCVATGEPRIALDVGAEAVRFSNPLLPRTRSEMALPLASRGQIIGALTIQSTQLAAFTADDISALRTMTSQVATTIENARLFQETQQRVEEQTVLFQLAQALSAQLSVDQVLQQIYAGASQLIDTANFYIGLYDPARHEVDFVINASDSLVDKNITTISADQGMTGYIIRTHSSLLIKRDVEAWLKANHLQRVGSAAQSWLGVPLMLGDQMLGVMSVQSYTTPDVYDEHDRDLLYLLGAQAAIAIQNARLFEQTRDARAAAESRLRETQTLQQFSQAVSQALDVPQVLDALVKTLQDQMNFTHIAIALIEPEVEQFTIVRGVGTAANLHGLRRPLSEVQADITMDILRRGQIEVLDGWDERLDRAIYERDGHIDLVRAFVPVRLRDEAIGLIEVGYQRAERAQISPEEIRVLGGLSDQMAIAIDNARLLEQVQTALGETEQLYTASRELALAADTSSMLVKLANHLPIADVNRIVLWMLEFDDSQAVKEVIVSAAWYSGAGEPPPPIGLRLPPNALLALQVAQSNQPVITHDVDHDERLTPAAVATLRQLHIQAVALLPLWAGDRQLGLLMLQAEKPHTFTEREIRPYTSLTQQMAISIENRRLFEQIQRDAERERTINRITSRLRNAQSVEQVLNIATQELRAATRSAISVAEIAPSRTPDSPAIDNGGPYATQPDRAVRNEA